jgi:hypothetical protein
LLGEAPEGVVGASAIIQQDALGDDRRRQRHDVYQVQRGMRFARESRSGLKSGPRVFLVADRAEIFL